MIYFEIDKELSDRWSSYEGYHKLLSVSVNEAKFRFDEALLTNEKTSGIVTPLKTGASGYIVSVEKFDGKYTFATNVKFEDFLALVRSSYWDGHVYNGPVQLKKNGTICYITPTTY